MTAYLTCRSCRHKDDCSLQQAIREAIKGLRVTSLRHTCDRHEAPYQPGQAVWAHVIHAPHEEYDESHKDWYPGHFLGISPKTNVNAIIFVQEGSLPRDGSPFNEPFVPCKGDGYAVCRVPWGRVEPRDGPAARVCSVCEQLEGMKCERDGLLVNRPCPLGAATQEDRP